MNGLLKSRVDMSDDTVMKVTGGKVGELSNPQYCSNEKEDSIERALEISVKVAASMGPPYWSRMPRQPVARLT